MLSGLTQKAQSIVIGLFLSDKIYHCDDSKLAHRRDCYYNFWPVKRCQLRLRN